MKKVHVHLDGLKQTQPHEYVVRFVFGGATTLIAALIGRRFGAVVGGLFLAFPAIFPASATLIETHEKRRMAKAGQDGTLRGRLAASVDARGCSRGCVGLAGFALVVWKGIPSHNATMVIGLATVVWLVVSYVVWLIPGRARGPVHRPMP